MPKKIFSVLSILILCAVFCACQKPGEIDLSMDELSARFNEVAKNTEYRLGKSEKNTDNTYSIATKDETARVICDIENDRIVEINVNGTGYYSPGLASFDYMQYVLMCVDKSFDETTAGDFIADLYYEASNGGDSVKTEYNGLQYEYKKVENDYWLTVKNPQK